MIQIDWAEYGLDTFGFEIRRRADEPERFDLSTFPLEGHPTIIKLIRLIGSLGITLPDILKAGVTTGRLSRSPKGEILIDGIAEKHIPTLTMILERGYEDFVRSMHYICSEVFVIASARDLLDRCIEQGQMPNSASDLVVECRCEASSQGRKLHHFSTQGSMCKLPAEFQQDFNAIFGQKVFRKLPDLCRQMLTPPPNGESWLSQDAKKLLQAFIAKQG